MKTRLNSIVFLLLIQVSLKPKPPRKTNVMETVKEAIQSLGSMPQRLPKRTKIKMRQRI